MILALIAAAAVTTAPPTICKAVRGSLTLTMCVTELPAPKSLCPASSVENEGGSVDTAMFGDGTCRDSSGVTRPMTCADVMQNYHSVYIVHGIFLGAKRCFPGGKTTPP